MDKERTMKKEEIALEILLKLLSKECAGSSNSYFKTDNGQAIDPEKVAETYNKILSILEK